MKYKLVCHGRLLDGADEQTAVQAIIKVTRTTEVRAKSVCSSGRQIALGSTEDKARLDKICQFLRTAGVDVEVVADVPQDPQLSESGPKEPRSEESRSESQANSQTPTKQEPANIARDRSRIWIAAAAALVVILISVAGYGWYWLYMTESPLLLKAERAVADGHLVAVAYVDVDKAAVLSDHVFGAPDPAALPVSDGNKELLDNLFSGPADFKHNLKQALFAMHVNPEGQRSDTTMLLSGNFDAKVIISELGRDYAVTALGTNQWELKDKTEPNQMDPVAVDPDGDVVECGDDNPQQTVQHKKEVKALRLRITPEWLMVSNDAAHADGLWQRLESGAEAAQDLQRWRSYRQGQLVALMVFVPADAVQSIDGMPGMMAQGAVQQMPDVTGVAMAAEVSIPRRGLNLNFSLFSENAQWNSDTAAKIQKQLDEMQSDSRSVSPTFAELFSRVSLHDGDDKLAVDVALNADLLDNMDTIVQEGLSSLFTPTISMAGNNGPQQERLNEHPTDYSLYQGLTKLPELKPDQFRSTPLFSDGTFAVDVKSVSYDEKGYFEIDTEANVGMPSGEGFMSQRPEKLVFAVDSVKASDGSELIRDERCMSRMEVFGTFNHEPETNFNTINDQASITKKIRLKPGVRLEDIDSISGRITLSIPTKVSKFTVPLKAGETIEHAGMRFYLSGAKDGSVTYQVSGQDDKLLEVRALNKQGKPLSSSWSMSDTSGPRRVTQGFQGNVAGLEIYIADTFLRKEKSFVLRDILTAPEGTDKENKKPAFFAPRHIDPAEWDRYAGHDMKQLKVDPKEWMLWGKNTTPVAETQWATAKMYVTHTPQQWGNNPRVHLYFPMVKGLPGVLSALSAVVDVPAPEDDGTNTGTTEVFHRVFYPYYSNNGESVVKHKLDGLAVAQQSFDLDTGLGDNEKLTQLKGKLIFRLPLSAQATRLSLNDLWAGKEVAGIRVSLTGIDRGMFPGYQLKIEGDIDKLVNVSGVGADGKPVGADPVNFQDGGYWTMVLPFNHGIEEIELITADRQKVIELPFDLKPAYAQL